MGFSKFIFIFTFLEMETRNFVQLKNYPNYEITENEPWQIRRKSDGRIMKQTLNKLDYYVVRLDGTLYYVHRIICEQFLPNPNNSPQCDHKDRNRSNNSLDNLRWVSHQINQNNLSSMRKITYEYLDELPEGFQPFNTYLMRSGRVRHFDNLYMKMEEGTPQFISHASEHQFRRLYVSDNMVQCQDIHGKQCHICFSRINKTQQQINTTQQQINQTQQALTQTLNTMANTLNTMAETLKTMTNQIEE
jgi:hypothetical protein